MFGFFSDHFLFFGLKISYYGFIIACAMAFGVWLACFNAKKRKIKSNDLLIAACYILPLAIIGARVYYFIFEMAGKAPFVDIFKIWEGGMAIYGGVLGGALGIGLYSLIHKKNFFDMADIVVPSLILGQAVGRVGCYFAGCCYGIEVTNEAIQFFPFAEWVVGASGGYAWCVPTRFYEIVWNLMSFVVLMLMLYKFKFKQRGAISAWYLILYGVGRAWIEVLRGDSLKIGAEKVSCILSIILAVAGLIILTVYYGLRERKQDASVLKNENKYKLSKSKENSLNLLRP